MYTKAQNVYTYTTMCIKIKEKSSCGLNHLLQSIALALRLLVTQCVANKNTHAS